MILAKLLSLSNMSKAQVFFINKVVHVVKAFEYKNPMLTAF